MIALVGVSVLVILGENYSYYITLVTDCEGKNWLKN